MLYIEIVSKKFILLTIFLGKGDIMKKILLSALLLLSVATARPFDLGGVGNAIKYANDLSALDSALKGDPQGFATLIDSAKGHLGDINFSELGPKHVENMISLAKTGMNSEDSAIRTAAEGFFSELKPKIQELAKKNPAEFLPLLRQLLGSSGGPDMPFLKM